MPKKRYNAEEIIHEFREADVLLALGRLGTHTIYITPGSACSQRFITTEHLHTRWVVNQQLLSESTRDNR